jgi:tRNA pseudouridine38-40 synthase
LSLPLVKRQEGDTGKAIPDTIYSGIFAFVKIAITLRYFIEFSYFGKAYHGWQRQPNALTVQQVLEEAFTTLVGMPVALTAAGRTDTGVHARHMMAHADMAAVEDCAGLVYRLNSLLPDDIAVMQIKSVVPEAHARFDALERTYEYWVVQEKDPFYRDLAYYLRYPLDLDLMNQAAVLLTEYRDFKCFSKSNTDVGTYDCDIRLAQWSREDGKLVFTITADRFLRNMVRAIVGTLIEIGQGRMAPTDVKGIIKSRDRARAGVSVPAKGLYLTRVSYPDNIFNPGN